MSGQEKLFRGCREVSLKPLEAEGRGSLSDVRALYVRAAVFGDISNIETGGGNPRSCQTLG